MSDSNKDTPRIQPGSDAAAGARKVRSSRYEWENKSSDSEHTPDRPSAQQKSLLTSLGTWVKRLVSSGSSLFDNDDDASPSAA